MTGIPVVAMSGDQMLSVSQLPSDPGGSPGVPISADWGGGGPNSRASRTPSQGHAGTGLAKRSSPTGGRAYGIPRNTHMPSTISPRTSPVVRRVSTCALPSVVTYER